MSQVYNKYMNIKRYYSPDQTVFITQVVKDRLTIFNDDTTVQLLMQVMSTVKNYHPFSMIAYVILPDHFHMLIRNIGPSNFSQIMHSLKRNFTVEFKRYQDIRRSTNLWQRRFWDHVIRDEGDFENHFHYIHHNPVKHGYVRSVSDWKFSSFFDWQKQGVYEEWDGWEEPCGGSWGE